MDSPCWSDMLVPFAGWRLADADDARALVEAPLPVIMVPR